MFLLNDYGILWQNARNLYYIGEYNDLLARKLADSKIKTKSFLEKKWVSVAETLMIIKDYVELSDALFDSLTPPFVIKPNAWYGGKGIIIINEKNALGQFVSSEKRAYTKEQLVNHFKAIIDGFFSLSWRRDKIIIERKIILNHQIELLGKYGLPDIRIIVFNLVPVIAMMRIPTEKSSWKANLHAWAAAVGIDIASGKFTNIMLHGKMVKSIPWIGDVRGIILPRWDDILTLAVKVQKASGLGYLGCDIVLDENKWPLLLEMNARAGLEIQVANMTPLKTRLERIEGIEVHNVEKWVRIGKDLFGKEGWSKDFPEVQKKVLWEKEFISFMYENKNFTYLASISPTKQESSIDEEFVENALKIDKKTIKKWVLKLDIVLLWEKRSVKFVIRNFKWSNISLWISPLKWFLYDPYKYKKWELPVSQEISTTKMKNIAINKSYEQQLKKIDSELMSIDKSLNILRRINPKNLFEEKEKFIISAGEYIPKFQYQETHIKFSEIRKKLDVIDIPDIPLSNLYNRKKEEIRYKLNFLEAFIAREEKMMQYYSQKLFGDIIEENLILSKEKMMEKKDIVVEDDFIGYEEIKVMIKKFSHIYNLSLNVKEDDIAARFVMKGDNLVMKRGTLLWKREARSVIAHEIEGHYLRKDNGKRLPYKIFTQGTFGYLEIDEWIAIMNQSRFLSEKDKKYYGFYERYFFAHYALKNSYKRLLKKMLDYYEDDYGLVFNYITRLKRWMNSFSSSSNFMKDVVYVNGYIKVEDYINTWGDMRELYIGKIAIDDLEEIKNSLLIPFNLSDIKTPFSL